MTTRDVSAPYVQQSGVSNSLLGSHTSLLIMLFPCFSLGQQISVTYGFVFITPGLWARKNRDLLGTVLGSVPSSWFQGKDHRLRDPAAMDRLPCRALSLLGTARSFIVESSFVLGKRNYQPEFHADRKSVV